MGQYDLFRKIAESDKTTQERTIDEMKYDITLDFCDSPSYKEAYFNGDATSTDIQVLSDSNAYEKKILMYPDDVLSVGDSIVFDSETWLCTESDKTNPIYESGVVQKCTHTLNVYKSAVLMEIPCIVSNNIGTWDSEEGKYTILPRGQTYIIVPNNSETENITYNQVYNIGRNNYKIVGVDDITKPNLLILTGEIVLEDETYTSPTSSLIISGNDIIIKNNSLTYTSNLDCTWSITNVDGTVFNYVTITSQTAKSIIIKAANVANKSIILKATATVDGKTITTEKRINITNLF